jgi:hypothetical protein
VLARVVDQRVESGEVALLQALVQRAVGKGDGFGLHFVFGGKRDIGHGFVPRVVRLRSGG